MGKKKETVVVLHPRAWARKGFAEEAGARFNYVHASIGGKVPRKRNGEPTYDGYADVVTEEGKQDLFNKCHAHKPVAVFYWMHSGLNPDVMAKVRKIVPNVKLVHWYSNHRDTFPKGVDKMVAGGFIDLLVFNHANPSTIKMFNNAGLKTGTFWDGFDPDEVSYDDEKQEYDCFFGGNTYQVKAQKDQRFRFPAGRFRHDFIRAVADRFNLRLHSAPAYRWVGLKTFPEVFHPKYTSVMRTAKIMLEANHFPEFRRAYTRRMIRSIFSGRCVVTLYVPGMEQDFTNHKNIVWFHNIEEGLELIDHYLKHDDEREKVAKACFKNAMENHTWLTRIHQFEDLLDRKFGL